MDTVNVSAKKLDKVLADVENLVEDVASIFDQDEMVEDRLIQLKQDPSMACPEKELDDYLKKRGVNID